EIRADHRTRPAIGKVIQLLAAHAKETTTGVDPEIAPIVRNNRVNDIVEQTLVAGDDPDLSVLETGHSGFEAGPDDALTVLGHAHHFCSGHSLVSAPQFEISVFEPADAFIRRDPDPAVLAGNQVEDPAQIGLLVGAKTVGLEIIRADSKEIAAHGGNHTF